MTQIHNQQRTKRDTNVNLRALARRFHLLFDYDNTLGKTEIPAFTACCGVVNETLRSKGVDESKLFTTETLMARFVGYSFRRMITDLAVEHGFVFDANRSEVIDGETFEPELEVLVKYEEVAVINKLATDIEPTKEINELLARLIDFEKSVVSSSAERRVRACLKGAGQEDFFQNNRVFSAANYKSSKPDPLVYLKALEAMNLNAAECLAIEDSKTGAMAALGAGITVIGYVGAYDARKQEHLRVVLMELGVAVIINHWSEFEASVAALALDRFGSHK